MGFLLFQNGKKSTWLNHRLYVLQLNKFLDTNSLERFWDISRHFGFQHSGKMRKCHKPYMRLLPWNILSNRVFPGIMKRFASSVSVGVNKLFSHLSTQLLVSDLLSDHYWTIFCLSLISARSFKLFSFRYDADYVEKQVQFWRHQSTKCTIQYSQEKGGQFNRCNWTRCQQSNHLYSLGMYSGFGRVHFEHHLNVLE